MWRFAQLPFRLPNRGLVAIAPSRSGIQSLDTNRFIFGDGNIEDLDGCLDRSF